MRLRLLLLYQALSSARLGLSPFLRLKESLPNQSKRSEEPDFYQLLLVYPFVYCMRHFLDLRRKVYPLAI